MGSVKFRHRSRTMFLDVNVAPGLTKDVDPGTSWQNLAQVITSKM